MDVRHRVKRMDVHPIRYLTRHACHVRADRRDVDLDIAEGVARRRPLRREQVEPVERAVVVELLVATKRSETCLDGQHVVAQPRPGGCEVGAVTPLDVCFDLTAETEPETTLGVVGELPRDRRRHHRAAWERDGDASRECECRSGGRGGRDLHPRHLTGLGVHHAGEADALEVDREACALRPGAPTAHQIEFHPGSRCSSTTSAPRTVPCDRARAGARGR